MEVPHNLHGLTHYDRSDIHVARDIFIQIMDGPRPRCVTCRRVQNITAFPSFAWNTCAKKCCSRNVEGIGSERQRTTCM